jgi:4-carboxymuconolactone decarboxylase
MKAFALMMAALASAPAPGCSRAGDRLPPIPVERYTDAQKQAVRALAVERGRPVAGPLVPLMRSPELMLAAKAMGEYLRSKSVLPQRIQELAVLVVSREWTQQVEWQVHHHLALQAGLRPDVVEAIGDGRRPAPLRDDEQAAYDMSIELLRNKRVSDETYRRAVAAFGEQGVVELLGVNGYSMLLSAVMNGARTAPSDPVVEPLRRFPD